VERGALPCQVNRRGGGSGWWYSVARMAQAAGALGRITQSGMGQGPEPGGAPGTAIKRKRGPGVATITTRAGSHRFKLAFIQAVNAPCRVGSGIRSRAMGAGGGGRHMAAAAEGDEPIPQGR
jgi:hypothetical protein